MAKANRKTHTDIKSESLIIRLLPSFLRPYGHLARLDRPIGWWLLLLPGWWSIVMASGGLPKMTAPDFKIFVLFFIGAIIMRAAGCTINDLWDRKLDRKVERTAARPLASGEISVGGALLFLALLLGCGLYILLQLSLVAVLLGFITIPFVVIYPLMKRITWWPQAFLGLTFNFGALIGWAAVTGILQLPALLLYVSGFFWTLGYDTIYAHQDKEDDINAGVKSAALKLGESSPTFIMLFYMISWVLALAAFFVAWAHPASYVFLLLAGLHLVWQVLNWNPQDHNSSLTMFKSNRNYGLLVLMAAFVV